MTPESVYHYRLDDSQKTNRAGALRSQRWPEAPMALTFLFQCLWSPTVFRYSFKWLLKHCSCCCCRCDLLGGRLRLFHLPSGSAHQPPAPAFGFKLDLSWTHIWTVSYPASRSTNILRPHLLRFSRVFTFSDHFLLFTFTLYICTQISGTFYSWRWKNTHGSYFSGTIIYLSFGVLFSADSVQREKCRK